MLAHDDFLDDASLEVLEDVYFRKLAFNVKGLVDDSTTGPVEEGDRASRKLRSNGLISKSC